MEGRVGIEPKKEAIRWVSETGEGIGGWWVKRTTGGENVALTGTLKLPNGHGK
jgi:hypothetical protein